MTTRLRKPLLVIGTTILIMQAVFMPIGMVYAETTMDTDEQEQVELPPTKNYLEEQSSDPRFFFPRSRMQGTAKESLQVTFFSDQEVSEASVFLPEEVTILKDQLQTGISVEEGSQPNEWIVQSKRAQHTFILPLVIEKAGNYQLSVEETTAHLEINEKEGTSEEVPVEEAESSEINPAGQEELKDENGIEEEQENEQSVEEVLEPVSEDPQEQQTDEEETEETQSVVESTVFDGEAVEVATMAQFREAVGNPDVGIISVQANLTEATANVLTVDRPLLIQGNGYTLTFGINGFYFQLEEVPQTSTLRIENATLTKVGTTPLINATVESSKNWSIELEDITEVNANTMRLASIPEGSIHFTGGVSNFTRIDSAETFIEAKEILATNQAEVSINRGNATVFFSSETVSTPTLTVENGASLSINTTIGSRVALDFRGYSPSINLQNNATFLVVSIGFLASFSPALSLNGQNGSINIINRSSMNVALTNAKRGIQMSGDNSVLSLDDSELLVDADTATAIQMSGDNSKIKNNNSSQINITSTGGSGIIISGESSRIHNNSSDIEINTITGTRINLIGDNSSLSLNESNLKMSSTTGAGIYLQGASPQVSINNSYLEINDTSRSQSVLLAGEDALLSIKNQSRLLIRTAQEDASGANTTTDALRIDGREAKFELSESSEIDILVANGSQTGLAILGDGNNARITQNSELRIFVDNANGVDQSGSDTIFEIDNNSRGMISTSVAGNRDSAGFFLGSKDETSSNSIIKVTNSSELAIASANASALTLLSDNSSFIADSDSSVNLHTSRSNGQFATLRFRTFGNYVFYIENASMTIVQYSGNAPAIRMFGGNNEVRLSEGATFRVLNNGNGTPHDGGVTTGGNIGIHYTSGGGKFVISGKGSEASIYAGNGPAIDMGDHEGEIKVTDGGYFEAIGNTATSNGGIFQADSLEVVFDNPLYMNFANTRSGGGNIFSVGSESSLMATNSDLALWRDGDNLEGDPAQNFPTLDYSLSGQNFNTLESTSKPEVLNTGTLGKTGLSAYSRLSSNNARWAIADMLRVPTNADKKIHGRVVHPVGIEGVRPAWDNEAIVTVEVESPSGETKKEYTTKTVGTTNESSGISIYGEAPQGGLFEIELEEPLEAGSKVRIIKVELASGELTEGFEHQILTDTVEVFPIIPPNPAQFSSSMITKGNTTIRGFTDTQGVEVTAKHNGESFNTENVVIDTDGNFTLDLSMLTLEKGDKIQVFLRDEEGSAKESGVSNPPETNNDRGNINPAKEMAFHDVLFEAATTLIVEDIGPVSPVDPLYPEAEVNPENKPELPENQGALSLDFVSFFNFDEQAISAQNQLYYAKQQRLLNEDGTVNEKENRPNYVQISDRRSNEDRNGWELSVTQKNQFSNKDNQELMGASLSFSNQEFVSVQGEQAPSLQEVNPLTLVPEKKRTLARAEGTEGTGTWIYRFGDGETSEESVMLDVPKGSNPEATAYSTTLIWELSAVPNN